MQSLEDTGAGQRKLLARIDRLRRELGGRLAILGHHYQRRAIVERSDLAGDSFKLARDGSRLEAELVVFCGVRFMAEAAAILARPGQKVFHPDPSAGCPMADMADLDDVRLAFSRLQETLGGEGHLPVVYMNSSSELKSMVGEMGGTVCTSANAPRAFRWVFARGRRVFFFPDRHLGWNTAASLGIPPEEICLYDFLEPGGGLDEEALRRARVILWSGFCHVHQFFEEAQVAAARRDHPDCRIIVHPECRPEVAAAADATGSTEQIIRYIEAAGPGTVIVVGTEINLVERMALTWTDRRVIPLAASLCPSMYKVTLPRLHGSLTRLAAGDEEGSVAVDDGVREGARLALRRMLELP